MPSMEEVIAMHKAKPMPIIKVPNFLRYRFDSIKKVKNPFLKKIKIMTETSLSAQLGTLPISVFYFNQFSGLFLFGNLVLIPASFLMICGGIISVILATLNLKFNFYVWLFNQFIHWSNYYIYWLASFKFVAKDIYISLFTAILIGIILFQFLFT